MGIRRSLKIQALPGEFSVCQVADFSAVDWSVEFCFAGKTDCECSLVCRTEDVPGNAAAREDGWRAFRVDGALDFSLIGILAEIASLLAEREISIFAVSTYRTDYILTKAADFQKAVQTLLEAGCRIV